MAAPLGNTNAQKGKIWTAAIQRALERREKCRSDGIKEIDMLAEELIKAVASGDLAALKEFGDRMEGKPAQQLIHTGDSENPVIIQASSHDETL